MVPCGVLAMLHRVARPTARRGGGAGRAVGQAGRQLHRLNPRSHGTHLCAFGTPNGADPVS
jgi:hypothetical protein